MLINTVQNFPFVYHLIAAENISVNGMSVLLTVGQNVRWLHHMLSLASPG